MMFFGDDRHRRSWVTYLLTFVVGIFTTLVVIGVWKSTLLCDTHFDFLNPDIACGDAKMKRSEWDYEPLRKDIAEKITRLESSTVPRVALYFRDIKNGPRLSFREQESFEPASLLKLPILMAYLHETSRYPGLLDERLTYDKEYHKDFSFGEEGEPLQLHSSYSIRELLEKMILYSDNTASFLLLDKINAMGLPENTNAFSDLGTVALLTSGQIDNTRLISLVNIFVALYNASYLPAQWSQYALNVPALSSISAL